MGFFDVSERWAENYSGRIAVEESNGYRITYREMAEVIRNHTGFYQDLQYDRIAVLGRLPLPGLRMHTACLQQVRP